MFPMLLISLITGFLLISITTLEHTTFTIFLVIAFGIVGLVSVRKLDMAYFGLLFVFPLVPSIPWQVSLPVFHLEEFLLLSFAFFWSLKSGLSRHAGLRQVPLSIPLLVLVFFFSLSAALALLRYNLLFSDVFLLKLKDHLNVFLHWDSMEDTGSLRALLTFTEGVLFYFITVDVLDQKQKIEKAIRVFFYSSACVAFVGLLQHVFQFRLLDLWLHDRFGLSRINSTFADPNSMGVYLAAALVVGGCSIFPGRKRSTSVLLVLIAAALFLSGSRSSWAALVLVALLFPFFARKLQCDLSPHLNKPFGLLFRYGHVFVFALMVLGFIKVTFYNPPANPQSGTESLQYIRWRWNRTLKGRPGVWHGAFLMFRADPVYGNGFGTFPRAIGKYKHVVPLFYRKENAHNYYLQLLAETGIVGLFLFVWIMFLIIRRTIRFLQSKTQSEDFLGVYGLLSGVLIFLVASLAQHPLLLLKLQLVFWFLIGTLLTIIRLSGTKEMRPSLSRAFWKIMIVIAFAYVPFQIHAILQTRQVPPYEHGFYEWQESKPVPFRITKPHTISLLPVQGRALAIGILPLKVASTEKPAFVEIYVNEQFIEQAVFSRTGWEKITCDLSRYHPNEVIRLELVFGNTQSSSMAVRPFQWLRLPEAVRP